MKLFIMLALTSLAMVVASGDSSCGDASSDSTQGAFVQISKTVLVCSRELSCIMEKLCNNDFKIIKRDTSYSSLMDKLVDDDLHDYLTKKSMVKQVKSNRVKRQIAKECCEKSCKIEELLWYCAADAKIFQHFPIEDT